MTTVHRGFSPLAALAHRPSEHSGGLFVVEGRQGGAQRLTNAAELCQEAVREFERIRAFLEAQMAGDAEPAAKA